VIRRSIIFLLSGGILLAIVIAACGGQTESTPPTVAPYSVPHSGASAIVVKIPDNSDYFRVTERSKNHISIELGTPPPIPDNIARHFVHPHIIDAGPCNSPNPQIPTYIPQVFTIQTTIGYQYGPGAIATNYTVPAGWTSTFAYSGDSQGDTFITDTVSIPANSPTGYDTFQTEIDYSKPYQGQHTGSIWCDVFYIATPAPSASPLASPTPPICVKLVDGSGGTAQQLVWANPPVEALVAYIYSHMALPKPLQQVNLPPIVFGTPPPGDPPEDAWARIDITDNTPQLSRNDIGLVQNQFGALSNDNNSAEVIYHEFLHFYLDWSANGDLSNAQFTLPYSGTGTAVVTDPTNGHNITLTYDLTGSTTGTGSRRGYEHLEIHDLILSAFGDDRTGALTEALREATWSDPSAKVDLDKIAHAYRVTSIPGSVALTATLPTSFTGCGSPSPYIKSFIVNPPYQFHDTDILP
jgi:hypothetical protein